MLLWKVNICSEKEIYSFILPGVGMFPVLRFRAEMGRVDSRCAMYFDRFWDRRKTLSDGP